MKTFHSLALLFLFHFIYVSCKLIKFDNSFFLKKYSILSLITSFLFRFNKLYKLSSLLGILPTHSLRSVTNVLTPLSQIKNDFFRFKTTVLQLYTFIGILHIPTAPSLLLNFIIYNNQVQLARTCNQDNSKFLPSSKDNLVYMYWNVCVDSRIDNLFQRFQQYLL